MVQFVALFVAGAATLVNYPIRCFRRSVASVGGVRGASRYQGGGSPERGRAGKESLECAPSRMSAQHISPPVGLPPQAMALAGSAVLGKSWPKHVSHRTEGSSKAGIRLAAEAI